MISNFKDPRIRSVGHNRNKGQSSTINTGVAEARGKYIAFIDDDDEWLPEKLERQVSILESSPHNVGLVYGWMDRIEDSTGRLIPSYRNTMEGNIFEESLTLNVPGPTIVLLVRTSVAREVGGYDKRLTRYNDADFICRVAQRYQVAVLPEVVAIAHFDHSHEQMGHEEPRYLGDAVNFLRTHMERFALELDDRPRTRAALLRRLASVELTRGNRSTALSALSSAFKLDPVGVSRAILRNHRLALKLVVRMMQNFSVNKSMRRNTDNL